jgi:membrane-associated PAP2 superfamily phosphatase
MIRSPLPPSDLPHACRQRDAIVVLVSLGLLMLWDLSNLDLAVSHRFGGVAGFALRDNRWTVASYDLGRGVAWIVVLLLMASLWTPVPAIGRVARSTRLWWLLTTVACLAAIPMLRSHSATSCPWSLVEFGGTASYVSHWWHQVDAGPGRCFPSGHATTGFAFFAGYFALREVDRRLARQWLAGALASGVLAAATQTMRGAHFASHSLWTAWLCWTLTAASWHAMRWTLERTRRRLAASAGRSPPFLEVDDGTAGVHPGIAANVQAPR